MRNLFQTFSKNKNNIDITFFSPNKQSRLTNYNLLKTCSNAQKNFRYSENGINDYYIQELKKAKYQGFFDPESYANKNIFIDNSILINESQISPNKKDHLFKSQDITNKKLLIENEGKNLLIFESESKYPLITYKRRINKRSIKSPYDYFIENKFGCSDNQSIQTNFNNVDFVDLNKKSQNTYFLKNNNKNNFQKYNQLTSVNNSNVFSDINTNIDFNDFNKFETFGKSINLCRSENEFQVNVFKLMDGYRSKLLQLFIERMKIFLKKNILRKFYKTIKEYIKRKEKNIIKNKIYKFTDNEIFNKDNNISFSINNSQEINRNKDFKKYVNNLNIISKNEFIYHNGNNQKKYDIDNFNTIINKNWNKTKNIFRKKYGCSSKINNLKKKINNYSNNKNHDTNLVKSINKIDNLIFQNDSPIKNQLSSIVMTKKSPKCKFLSAKKKSYESQTYLLKKNNLITNLQKTIFKNNSRNNIKSQKMSNYISSDNRIYINTKYYIYIPKINYNKRIQPKLNYFDINLLKIINNDNFYYLTEIKKNNFNKDYCTQETNCGNLRNLLTEKNNDNFNNSEKLNKGILLLQNLVNKNYEEKFNNSGSSVESELININDYIKKEEDGINNNVNEDQTNQKNDINSKLKKIITSIENIKNQNLLKNYFHNFLFLLDNKAKKQVIVQKVEILCKVQKTILSSPIKNNIIDLENNPVEISDNLNTKNPSEISPLNFDKIKNIDNFNENIKKEDINSMKLENELSGYSFMSILSIPKRYSSRTVNELIKNKDESFYEYYHKSQDFIFSFRLLLILNFLNKKNIIQD